MISTPDFGSHLNRRQRAIYSKDNLELKVYYWIFITLSSMEASLIMFIQGNISVFLPIFLHFHLHLSMAEATFYATIPNFTTCFVLIVFIVLAFRLDNCWMLYTNFILLTIGFLVMLFAVHLSKIWLIVSMLLLGFGSSSCFPLFLGFIEKRITISNTISALQCFASSILATLNPIIFGDLFVKDPLFFMWFCLVLLIFAIIIFITLHAMDIWLKHIHSNFKHIPDTF